MRRWGGSFGVEGQNVEANSCQSPVLALFLSAMFLFPSPLLCCSAFLIYFGICILSPLLISFRYQLYFPNLYLFRFEIIVNTT